MPDVPTHQNKETNWKIPNHRRNTEASCKFPSVTCPQGKKRELPDSLFSFYFSTGYGHSGFLTLQKAVDDSIIKQMNPSAEVDKLHVELQRFPYPAYTIDKHRLAFMAFFPLLIFICFCPSVFCLAEDPTKEKETIIRVCKTSVSLFSILDEDTDVEPLPSAMFSDWFVFSSPVAAQTTRNHEHKAVQISIHKKDDTLVLNCQILQSYRFSLRS